MEKIRYAVIGLGHFAQTAVLPAFKHAENSELAALITIDPEKAKKLSRQYGVKCYAEQDLEKAIQGEGANALYIATPNAFHRDHTERAAQAGSHVLCEKPMAVNEDDCLAMIRVTNENRVKLMVGYRLHFNDANLHAIEVARSNGFGEPRYFNSVFGVQVKDPGNVRLQKKLGGGTLPDIGIYCINAARYLFRAEPTEVLGLTANKREKRFAETEEMIGAILSFPGDRLATFTCSFNSAHVDYYDLVGTKGCLRLNNAYGHLGEKRCVIQVGGRTMEKIFAPGDQVAPELIYFSDCILNDREPEPCGREGLADVRIINAIYESAKTGRKVQVEPISKENRPEHHMQITRPPVEQVASV